MLRFLIRFVLMIIILAISGLWFVLDGVNLYVSLVIGLPVVYGLIKLWLKLGDITDDDNYHHPYR